MSRRSRKSIRREPTPKQEGEQIIDAASKAGKHYALDQVESDHFRDWVYDQMLEAEQMRRRDPSSVVPLESPADARKVARNMLQQLEWDTKRQMDQREILELAGATGVFGAGSDDWVRDTYGITRKDVTDTFFDAFDEALQSTSVREWLTDLVLQTKEDMGGNAGVSESRRQTGGGGPVSLSINNELAARLIGTGFNKTIQSPTETWVVHPHNDPGASLIQVQLFKSANLHEWVAWTGQFTNARDRDLAFQVAVARNAIGEHAGRTMRAMDSIRWERSGGGTGWRGTGAGGRTYLLRRAGGADRWNLHIGGVMFGPIDSLDAAKREAERHERAHRSGHADPQTWAESRKRGLGRAAPRRR